MTETTDRRLPIYLLLDCSESMVGDGIQDVEKGMDALAYDLKGEPLALETIWISVITFSATPEQIVPLTELPRFLPPRLKVRPGTALGGALALLESRIRSEVRIKTGTTKGDWRPLVFLLTDGSPTDDWENAASRIKHLGANVISIGCGEDVDVSVLEKISNQVMVLQKYSPGDFKKMLHWVSASVLMSVPKICTKETDLSLADLPGNALMRSSSSSARSEGTASERTRTGSAREVFLAVYCSTRKLPYLIRYRRVMVGEQEVYAPARAHLIDEDYFASGDAAGKASLSSNQIMGVLPCPRCESSDCVLCPICGTWLCCPADAPERTCPKCSAHLQRSKAEGGNGSFSVITRIG